MQYDPHGLARAILAIRRSFRLEATVMGFEPTPERFTDYLFSNLPKTIPLSAVKTAVDLAARGGVQ